ncbi:hypothetical protein A3G50_00750 [Candidatus Jorgensenbacteria bacterium RIFCSPLOWO2_12_FULL_42_11]|uniref:UPF0235 protein A3G50_00750 n=1 Tax=Candidatus Jorgensenbacteria bacterium RIFCSPLOWO2_12_FULL_42_11 TaxID=1798473 RepID=A0A1F6C3G6_9BACT|nr:MAG: hypothetical protein A3G50_00750 [Candidatus Jorgensenbacteria bacterium RIFCSPLOWO2_12_FULL_42_11]
MKIFVKAKPNAKEEKVQKIDDNHYLVAVKEPPAQGKANRAIIEALATYFGMSSLRINIISGHISRNKIIVLLRKMSRRDKIS